MSTDATTKLYDLRFNNGVATLSPAAAGKEAYIPAPKFSTDTDSNVKVDIAAAIATGQHIRVTLPQLAKLVFGQREQSRVVAYVYKSHFTDEAKTLVENAARRLGFIEDSVGIVAMRPAPAVSAGKKPARKFRPRRSVAATQPAFPQLSL